MTNRRAIRWVSIGLGIFGMAGGLVTLLGWATNVRRLTDWDGDGISMQPNRALAAACAGAALLFGTRRRWALAALAILCVALGGLTVFENATGRDLHLDQLLFDKPWESAADASADRMGPPGAISYTLLGIGLLLLLRRPGGPARATAAVLGLVAVSITLLGEAGYLFGANNLYAIPRVTGIAFQTAVIVMALGLALAAAVPEHPPALVLWEDSAAGMLARRALPLILVMPFLLGWIEVQGQRAGLYGPAMGTALLVVSLTVLTCAVLWWGVHTVRIRERELAAVDQARRREIAERKRAEEALREADVRKDEFLATLAHELRGPLAPVRNWLVIMERDRHVPGLMEQGRAVMERQLVQMVRLIDDLLDVGRITRNRLQLRKQRVELRPIVELAVEACRPLADEKGHELRAVLPIDPVELDADPVRLVQVFQNLLTNACRYTDPGGRIVIEAMREGSEAVVRVRDNGHGLPPEALPHVFDMFSRTRPEDGSEGGLGLGLPLVKRLVEMHGATVTASSEGLGRGSEFVVRMPALAAAPAAPPATANAPARVEQESSEEVSLQGCRVLVVDDNPDSAESLALFLSLRHCESRTARDGVEAVEAARTFRPHVILLDIGLPRMDGYEACQAIRREPWGAEMVIVALTGWGQEQDRVRSKAAGFDHHLVKPVELAALTRLLAERLPSPQI